MFAQPSSFEKQLFPHQLKSVNEMIQVEANAPLWKRSGCIESDMEYCFNIGLNSNVPGFGKTLEMLALLYYSKMQRLGSASPSPVSAVEQSVFKFQHGQMSDLACSRQCTVFHRKVDSALVLVSPSILGQWVSEIGGAPLTYRTVLTKKHIVETAALLERSPEQIEDIILCVPTMWNALVKITKDTAFRRFLFDEPGHMHLPLMMAPQADFTWLLTATPNDLRNLPSNRGVHFLSGLRSTNARVFDEWLHRASIRNTMADVEMSVQLPEIVQVRHRCLSGITRIVYGIVSENVFAMLQAGDVESAAASLGSTSSINIIDIVRKQMQDRLSIMVARMNSHRAVGESEIMRARLVVEHDRTRSLLATLEARVTEMLGGDCIICQDKLVNPVMEPSCQNIFCATCILNWLNVHDAFREPRCPTCRVLCKATDLIFLAPERVIEADSAAPPRAAVSATGWIAGRAATQVVSRSETVARIIVGTAIGERVLVFSTQDRSFDGVIPTLVERGITCAILKGSSGTRTNLIRMFNEGQIRVLCLNSMSDGAGLNLPSTDHVVLFHAMPRYREQVVARAQRIGRTGPLHVHEVVAE